jgi:hypothetical protein
MNSDLPVKINRRKRIAARRVTHSRAKTPSVHSFHFEIRAPADCKFLIHGTERRLRCWSYITTPSFGCYR